MRIITIISLSMDWITTNAQWIFSGIGATAMGAIFHFIKRKDKLVKSSLSQNNNGTAIVAGNDINIFSSPNEEDEVEEKKSHRVINVLFIDDDTKFKIVDILKTQKGINCQIVKDVKDFSQIEISSAHIIFVDIEGVGKVLTPNDQGLGLVCEIKERFPDKKIIIYSSDPQRDMTHKAFRVADGVLRKDAQPSQFIRYIEEA